jgi:hypothetical protein
MNAFATALTMLNTVMSPFVATSSASNNAARRRAAASPRPPVSRSLKKNKTPLTKQKPSFWGFFFPDNS